MNYLDEIISVELTRDELCFITENALNSYWNECYKELQRKDLGDIEKEQLEKCRDKVKRIMKKLDPLS